MLQCVAACFSVLQSVAVCCKEFSSDPSIKVLRRVGGLLQSLFQCVSVYHSVLQCVEVHCSVLQCVAVCCNVSIKLCVFLMCSSVSVSVSVSVPVSVCVVCVCVCARVYVCVCAYV